MIQRIPIDKYAKIEIEDNNYTLLYKREKTDNAIERRQWCLGGYFPTLEQLLDDYVKNAPAHDRHALHSLQEVVDCIQNAQNRIEKLITKK